MAKLIPQSLEALVFELSRLPGVGERTALRYALSFLKMGTVRIEVLEQSLKALRQSVGNCSTCHFWVEGDACAICSDSARFDNKICVVRDSPDVLALEKFRRHPWKYHVLQGLLSPLSGVGPRELRLETLFKRLETGSVQEVILALDATVEGDATAFYIKEYVKEHYPTVKLSRTAMGLPAGSSLEYLDASTLESALNHRTQFE